MANTTTTEPLHIQWEGTSGKLYDYWIYPIDGVVFNPGQPGNYIFAKQVKPHTWVAVYIGQTKDLRDRHGDHEKQSEAEDEGATHIHVHLNTAGEKARLDEEKDLIQAYQPVCNTQHIA